jgi:hypothetical protein
VLDLSSFQAKGNYTLEPILRKCGLIPPIPYRAYDSRVWSLSKKWNNLSAIFYSIWTERKGNIKLEETAGTCIN